jgi:molybdopterin converting factor small subunit
VRISVVVTGRLYHAASQLPGELALPNPATVDNALAALAGHLPPGVELPRSCLVVVSGEHLGTLARHTNHILHDGDELTLIAPVAGG